ncbi:MAG: hypothetical protein QW754_05650 [Thermoplasmata archaeon]
MNNTKIKTISEVFEKLKAGNWVDLLIDDWVYSFIQTGDNEVYFYGKKENSYQEGVIDYEYLSKLLNKYDWREI